MAKNKSNKNEEVTFDDDLAREIYYQGFYKGLEIASLGCTCKSKKEKESTPQKKKESQKNVTENELFDEFYYPGLKVDYMCNSDPKESETKQRVESLVIYDFLPTHKIPKGLQSAKIEHVEVKEVCAKDHLYHILQMYLEFEVNGEKFYLRNGMKIDMTEGSMMCDMLNAILGYIPSVRFDFCELINKKADVLISCIDDFN